MRPYSLLRSKATKWIGMFLLMSFITLMSKILYTPTYFTNFAISSLPCTSETVLHWINCLLYGSCKRVLEARCSLLLSNFIWFTFDWPIPGKFLILLTRAHRNDDFLCSAMLESHQCSQFFWFVGEITGLYLSDAPFVIGDKLNIFSKISFISIHPNWSANFCICPSIFLILGFAACSSNTLAARLLTKLGDFEFISPAQHRFVQQKKWLGRLLHFKDDSRFKVAYPGRHPQSCSPGLELSIPEVGIAFIVWCSYDNTPKNLLNFSSSRSSKFT